jgi:hypothetical protein
MYTWATGYQRRAQPACVWAAGHLHPSRATLGLHLCALRTSSAHSKFGASATLTIEPELLL